MFKIVVWTACFFYLNGLGYKKGSAVAAALPQSGLPENVSGVSHANQWPGYGKLLAKLAVAHMAERNDVPFVVC